jgi:hypothetical protein
MDAGSANMMTSSQWMVYNGYNTRQPVSAVIQNLIVTQVAYSVCGAVELNVHKIRIFKAAVSLDVILFYVPEIR